LLDRLLSVEDNGYAPWFDREACLAAIETGGLPAVRSEAWRHTNVTRWYETALAETRTGGKAADVEHPDEVEVVDFAEARAEGLVGEFGGGALDLGRHPLAAVNGLLLGSGLVIRAPRASHAPDPVRILDLPAAYQRVLVVVEPGATLRLVEEPASYRHRLVEVLVGRGARFLHGRRQAESPHRECSLAAVRVEAGGRYELDQLSLGADLRRNDIAVTLAGEGAEATIRGAWRLGGRRHLDTQVAVDHAAPGGTSRQTYRGVADDASRAVLNGRIHIAPDAQRSDASLTTKNLLASPTAEVYAKPELEIYANDVKCSHGATVGAIDEDAVHYFRTRGIEDATARALFVRGFLREAIEDVHAAERLGVI